MKKFEKNIEDRKHLVNRLIVEDGADEQVLNTLIAEEELISSAAEKNTPENEDGGIRETQEAAEDADDAADETGLTASISFPLSKHTTSSVINLICMIHSRCPLLFKATCGTFAASKELTDDLLRHPPFVTSKDVLSFLREREHLKAELKGLSFDDEKITFDGFGISEDVDYLQTFMKLAAAMNTKAGTGQERGRQQ